MIGSVQYGHLHVPYVSATGTRGSPTVSQTNPTDPDAVRRARRATFSLRRLLEQLHTELAGKRTRAAPAVARSSQDLGIDTISAPTTLRSTEPVNNTPTSFSPFGPSFAGASTSEASLTGVYDGSENNDTLTFDVKKGGTVGANDKTIQIDVRDGSGSKIDSIVINKLTPADTEFTLKNGLIASFSAGDLIKNDTFTVDVYADVGSAVDPDNPFDGTRNDNPNFDYGTQVTAGSFEVNGVAIAVGAGDTINDVLARITASDAGVTASFDASTEQLVLEQKTAGAEYDIVLGNDTSNFLAATKLDGAVSVPGQIGEAEEQPIAQVPGLSGIGSGTALVNGVGVAVDVDTDSLLDVIARINASGAGATATLSSDAQRVKVVSDNPSTQLVLDDGDTGLFSGLYIDEGTYEQRRGSSGPPVDRVSHLMKRAAKAFNDFFREAGSAGSPTYSALKSTLQDAVKAHFGTRGPRFRTEFGARFDFGASAKQAFRFSSREQAELRSALVTRFDEVREFFLDPRGSNEDGLLGTLIEKLKDTESEYLSSRGQSGVLIDTTV